MSLKAFALTFAACLMLSAPLYASAQQPSHTLYWSPVTLAGPCDSFTVEDAQNINYSFYDQFGAQNVHVSVITAQLYLNGMPYKMANIPITFTSDNDSVAVLEPLNRTRPSDTNGQAKILLIANNTIGLVNITAISEIIHGHPISDTCMVRVVGWGTVSGIVTDQNRNGIPYATVTLWHRSGFTNTDILQAKDNPQLTNDGSTAAPGMYTFTYVPEGAYNVTGEKDGHVYYRLIDVNRNSGTITANVAIPDYSYIAPATPTPTPLATPTPTLAATLTNQTAALPTPGFSFVIAIAALGVGMLVKRKLF